MIRQLESGKHVMSPFQFRLYNELPTLFLIGIVPLAVFKSLADYLIVIFVLFFSGLLLFIFAKWYKRQRGA